MWGPKDQGVASRGTTCPIQTQRGKQTPRTPFVREKEEDQNNWYPMNAQGNEKR